MTRDFSNLPTTSRFSAPDDHPGLEDLVAYLDRVERLGPFRALQDAADDQLDVQPGHSVLDVGCGLGRATREAARRAGISGEAVGIDISNALLRIAESRSAMTPRPRYVYGDAAGLPFPACAFDRIRAERLLMHVANPRAVLTEIARLLRPGGLVVLIEPNWRSLELVHADRAACEILKSVFDITIKNPSIGAELVHLCEAAGLSVTAKELHHWCSTDLAEIDLTLQLDRVAEIAVREGLHAGPPEKLTRSLQDGAISASLAFTCVVAARTEAQDP